MSAYYNEFDPRIAAWLRKLISADLIAPGDVDERSIEDVQPADVAGYTQCHFFAGIGGWSYALRLAGWPDDRPVWTASCPCQGYSLAGGGEGTEDRRDLWPVFFRLIPDNYPTEIFGEQVDAAILWGWLDRLCDDLESKDYAIGKAVLSAKSVGAWHERPRVYWVASHGSSERGERLVSSPNTRFAGQGWSRRQKNLPSLISSPFVSGPSWPQPLLRSLDDGISSRVVGCHGAGNAIVPQVAAEFIQAFMELEGQKS